MLDRLQPTANYYREKALDAGNLSGARSADVRLELFESAEAFDRLAKSCRKADQARQRRPILLGARSREMAIAGKPVSI
jgi:hypothetical protein